MVPGIKVVHMVLHIIEFVNRFSCQGGVKHFSPDEIMTGCVYCQVTENIQPWNSLAPQTRAANLVGSLGNLSGSQVFLVLDAGHILIRHH